MRLAGTRVVRPGPEGGRYCVLSSPDLFFFFFNDTATTEIYTLSLHDALPISNLESADPEKKKAFIESINSGKFHNQADKGAESALSCMMARTAAYTGREVTWDERSEEHTSELQSLAYLVCRLLLEKKKNIFSH